MASGFPKQDYVEALVKLMDKIKYKDENYTDEVRVQKMRIAYQAASSHFARPEVRDGLKIPPKRLEACFRTIAGMVVFCWVQADLELTAVLAIFYSFILLLDDNNSDPHTAMESFVQDMIQGNRQKHPWWRLVNNHFPALLRYYGPFCSLNIYRGTVDFFEGCWIEQRNFGGFSGDHEYPDFLRRLNGVGHAVGATIWPATKFDDRKLFQEITTAVCMLGQWEVWVNDLLSFYKEFDDANDQNTLVRNYMRTEGLTVEEALKKLTTNVLDITERIMKVFSDTDEEVRVTITKFVHGYLTWHLCDKRYRMVEFYEQVPDDETGRKFRKYFEGAAKVGRVDPALWAIQAAPVEESTIPEF